MIEGDSFLNFQLCTRDERYKQGRAGLLFHVQGIRARDLIQRGGRFAESRRGNDLHSAARTTSSFKPFRPMAAGSVFLDAGVGCCLPTAILFFQAKRNLCWRRGTKEDGEDTEGAKGQERRGSAIERLKGEKTKELWGREVTRRTRARLREKWKRGAGAKRGSLCFSLNREMRQEEGSKPWIFVGCGSGKSPGGCTIREGLAGASLARASARGWRAPRA